MSREENSSFTNISLKAQTSDIKKHKSHHVLILLFISFLYTWSMHLLINSYFGEEYSHENKIAGKMSTIPLVPKLKTAEKSTHLERETRNRGHQRIFSTSVCYVSENVTLVL